MKRLGWIALSLLLAGGAVLTVAWPALTELWRVRTFEVVRVDTPVGTLDGVQIRVDASRALSFSERPDRAIIWLRLGISGDAKQLESWLGCDLALIDDSGNRWLPLGNETGVQIVRVLSESTDRKNSCGQAAYGAAQSGAEELSDQAFLVPKEVVDRLRLHISGLQVRTRALSLPLGLQVLQQPN